MASVRNNIPLVRSGDRCLAYHLLRSEPLFRTTSARAPRWQRHRPDRRRFKRRSKALAIYGDHQSVIPMDRRGVMGQRRPLDTRAQNERRKNECTTFSGVSRLKRTSYCLFDTAFGWCGVAWDESGGPLSTPAVTRLKLPGANRKSTENLMARDLGTFRSEAPPSPIRSIIGKVRKHLLGEPQKFNDTAISLDGIGGFGRLVYEVARRIPPGETLTYGEMARIVGHPTATRAIGRVLGRNPIGLIVPCHRIIGARGHLGGFSAYGGISTKARILAPEGIVLGHSKDKLGRREGSTGLTWAIISHKGERNAGKNFQESRFFMLSRQ